MDDRLSRAWSPVSHMNSVVNSDALRQAYNACLPKLSQYHTEIGQNRDLYTAIKSLADSEEYGRLDAGQQTVIQHALRDFHLGGVDLPEQDKQRFGEISQRLSELQSTFSENVLDGTDAWSRHVTDEALLAGMTESGLAMARQAAEAKGLICFDLSMIRFNFVYSSTLAQGLSGRLRRWIMLIYVDWLPPDFTASRSWPFSRVRDHRPGMLV